MSAPAAQVRREGATDLLPVHGLDLRPETVGLGYGAQEDVDGQRPVGLRVDGHAVDELGGVRQQVDRPVDAAEDPVVAPALRAVDRGVGGLLVDGHLQPVPATEGEHVGDVVGEADEAALVHRTDGRPVDPHAGVRHAALEDDEHLPTAPGRGGRERVLVHALLVRLVRVVVDEVPVVVGPVALGFPVRRHGNGGPLAGVPPAGQHETPVDHVILVRARQVGDLGPRRRRVAVGGGRRPSLRGQRRRRDAERPELEYRPPAEHPPSSPGGPSASRPCAGKGFPQIRPETNARSTVIRHRLGAAARPLAAGAVVRRRRVGPSGLRGLRKRGGGGRRMGPSSRG